jgi:hypothetical protein
MVSVADIISKIMIEILSVLALTTKQIKQGRFSKCAVMDTADAQHVTEKFVKLLQGKDDIHAALKRLDRLTMNEGLAAGALTLGIVHNLALGDQLQVVQQWLFPPDSSSTYHDFVSKRQSGTAAWFFESNKLTEWEETGSLLWIHGKRMFFKSPTSAWR